MSFGGDAGLLELILVPAENLAERLDLLAHLPEHLFDGVDASLPALIAIERVLDGHVLGELHQHRPIHPLGRRRGSKAGQCLLERHLCAGLELRNLGAQLLGLRGGARLLTRLPHFCQQAENAHHIVFARREAARASHSESRPSASAGSQTRPKAGARTGACICGRAGTAARARTGVGSEKSLRSCACLQHGLGSGNEFQRHCGINTAAGSGGIAAVGAACASARSFSRTRPSARSPSGACSSTGTGSLARTCAFASARSPTRTFGGGDHLQQLCGVAEQGADLRADEFAHP